MSDTPDNSFIAELTSLIEKNIANEQFGVSELAAEMNMSRSNLLRKVKKESQLSVSQLISQVRLKKAMELLRKTSANVSEVAHQVGFNSTSYFIKCFREYYGFPPGEVGKRETPAAIPTGRLPEFTQETHSIIKRRPTIVLSILVPLIALVSFVVWNKVTYEGKGVETSIAVLPFKNDSNDSTNLYLINGLMESTLGKLHQIRDVRVVSRTSVEKYRNTTKSIAEMAKELNVKYLVEGSGQKLGDRIVLNIQLIDGETDKHLWSRQYRREAKDIFELQEEIARNITQEIRIFLSPEDESKIEQKPTEDPVAYDYYLKGKDLFYRSTRKEMEESIAWFDKAIERDPKFSLAYATAAMVFYYLDIFHLEKTHTEEIDQYAEKAILYDSKSSESMLAKALSFAQKRQYELSIPYFEKAHEYDPYSGIVLHFLTEFYNIHIPHPPKYLEYAIQKVKVDRGADSATLSHDYFHLSNALVQNGFIDEALKYNNISQQFNPKHYFAGFVNDYILYAKDHDSRKASERLYQRWKKDTTRFDILQEVGKMSAMSGDFKFAADCYDRSLATMKMFGLDIFQHEYLRIGETYDKVGQKVKADEYVQKFLEFVDRDKTMYKDLHLMGFHIYKGDNDKAMQLFKQFANEQDNFLYWILTLPNDKTCDELKKHPDFNSTMKKVEDKFWAKHEELKQRFGDDIAAL